MKKFILLLFVFSVLVLDLFGTVRSESLTTTTTTTNNNNNETLNDVNVNKIRKQIENFDNNKITTDVQEKIEYITSDYSVNNYENYDEIKITSKNYPNPYPVMENYDMSLIAEGGDGVDIILHFIDLDPINDYLLIRGGDRDSTDEEGIMHTGKLSVPRKLRILHTNKLYIKFQSKSSNVNHEFKGFMLTYSPHKDTLVTLPPVTTDSPIKEHEIEYVTKSVVVGIQDQNPKTWEIFRDFLTDTANQYIEKNGLKLTPAIRSNVLFKSIKPCPETWRNHETCIQFDFAIPLLELDTKRTVSISANETETEKEIKMETETENEMETETESQMKNETDTVTEVMEEAKILIQKANQEPTYELSAKHLNEMWKNFGSTKFESKGFPIYDHTVHGLLAIWLSIGLGIVGAFVLVLFAIWKFDAFREYNPMIPTERLDDDEKRKSDIDISMYPAPYQTLPTLFPSTDGYAQFSTPTYGFMNSSEPSYDDKVYENDGTKKKLDPEPDYDIYKKRVGFNPEVENYGGSQIQSQRGSSFQPDDDLEIEIEMPALPDKPPPSHRPHFIRGASFDESKT